MSLFTIGHSNHSIEAFIALLHQHGVTALADVRSHPYSRYLPHFNQKLLKVALLETDIQYVFLGQELGARPNNPDCYMNGKAIYEKIAATALFQTGIQRLLKGTETHTIALMCAERDPLTCHRAILICQHLRDMLEIDHILSTGELETHLRLEERLMELNGFKTVDSAAFEQLTLFDQPGGECFNQQESTSDLLAKAYQRQSDRIAYVEKQEELEKQERDHEAIH